MNHAASIQQVTRDVLDLCELQMQLLSVDSQVAKRKVSRAVACGLAALALAGSGLTILFAGSGLLLSEWTSLSAGGALLALGASVMVIVVALLVVAAYAMKSAANAMGETKSELAENLRWLKATLVSPESSARNQIRRDDFPDRTNAHSSGLYPESDARYTSFNSTTPR